MTDQLMGTTSGSFTYYLCDVGIYMFTVWNLEHTSCGTHSCTVSDRKGNIENLEGCGYIDRTFLGQRFNHQTRQWEG